MDDNPYYELGGDPELADAFDEYERLPLPGENDVFDAFCARKNIGRDGLLRIGTRLADYRTLAFAVPGGVKFRNMENDDRWNMPGSEFKAMRMWRGEKRSDVVIVAEGETDAARLTELYPEAHIAILPTGVPYGWKKAFAPQLLRYPQVLVGTDPDTAGDAGWEAIRRDVPHAERFTAPGDVDWADLEGDPPPLPKPVEREIVGTIVFESFDALLENGVPEPELLVSDVLYEEGVHLFSGHPGGGKTSFVMHLAHLVMAQKDSDYHVVWLDFESGIRPLLRRLLDCGIPLDLLRGPDKRFHYAGWPAAAEENIAAIGTHWPQVFVVIDSYSKALASAGLNEDKNSEVTPWNVKVVQAAKTHGMPVAIIDHITKDGEEGQYSRGAGAKLADTDVHWRVLKAEEFNRNTSGVLHLKQMKDREGMLKFDTWWQVGDGDGRLTLAPLEGDPNKPPPEGVNPDVSNPGL